MTRDNINIWTEDMIRKFRELHAEIPELSFGQIAVSMSIAFDIELTRNACIGKARRLGFPMRNQVKTIRKPTEKKTRMLKPVDAPIAPPEEPAPLPEQEGLTIYQLRDGDCRWVLDPVDSYPPYTYCGEPTEIGCSWCYEHRGKVYGKPRVEWA